MSDVIYLHEVTDGDIPPERVLDAAKERCTEAVIVIGWGEDEEVYFAMSTGDAKAVLYALETAKFMLMHQLVEYDD
jgi:hypothetical protein